MQNQKHYTGLTDAQVLESRKLHGVNILTPPEKETVWDKIKEACTHWIVLSLLAILVGTVIAAFCLRRPAFQNTHHCFCPFDGYFHLRV